MNPLLQLLLNALIPALASEAIRAINGELPNTREGAYSYPPNQCDGSDLSEHDRFRAAQGINELVPYLHPPLRYEIRNSLQRYYPILGTNNH